MQRYYSNDEALSRLIQALELYIYYIENQKELNEIFVTNSVIDEYFILLLGYNYINMYLLDDVYLNEIINDLQIRKDKKLPFTYNQEKLYNLFKNFIDNEEIKNIWLFSKADKKNIVKKCVWNHINNWLKVFKSFDVQIEQKQVFYKDSNLCLTLTERAKTYFNKAVSLGYLETTEMGYKSKFNSKALLAYFLEWVFCRDESGKDNGQPFPETEANNLFNETRLGKARGQYINNKNGKPTGYNIIDELFK